MPWRDLGTPAPQPTAPSDSSSQQAQPPAGGGTPPPAGRGWRDLGEQGPQRQADSGAQHVDDPAWAQWLRQHLGWEGETAGWFGSGVAQDLADKPPSKPQRSTIGGSGLLGKMGVGEHQLPAWIDENPIESGREWLEQKLYDYGRATPQGLERIAKFAGNIAPAVAIPGERVAGAVGAGARALTRPLARFAGKSGAVPRTAAEKVAAGITQSIRAPSRVAGRVAATAAGGATQPGDRATNAEVGAAAVPVARAAGSVLRQHPWAPAYAIAEQARGTGIPHLAAFLGSQYGLSLLSRISRIPAPTLAAIAAHANTSISPETRRRLTDAAEKAWNEMSGTIGRSAR